MAVDWGLAVKLGAMGFGLVFFVLFILAFAIWLANMSVRIFAREKSDHKKEKTGGDKSNVNKDIPQGNIDKGKGG